MATQAKDGRAKRGPVGKILLVALGLYQAVFIAWILIAVMLATLPASDGAAAGGGPGIDRIAMLVFFWAAGSLLLWYAVKKEEKVRTQLAK